jgi:hypothetical protein
MYLSSVRMKNYRCFADETIQFSPGVNVLLGENNSGKTTVIKALALVLDQRRRIRPDHFDFHHPCTNRSRPDLHRRAMTVVLLQTLVRFGPRLDTMTLHEAYDAASSALTSQFGDIRLKKITGGGFANIADRYKIIDLLHTVEIRNSEEVRKARTIHKAKGAEEQNVLVCLHGKNTQQPPNHILQPAPKSDEEHRVTYVGISRARDRLFLAAPALLPAEESSLTALGISVLRLAGSAVIRRTTGSRTFENRSQESASPPAEPD